MSSITRFPRVGGVRERESDELLQCNARGNDRIEGRGRRDASRHPYQDPLSWMQGCSRAYARTFVRKQILFVARMPPHVASLTEWSEALARLSASARSGRESAEQPTSWRSRLMQGCVAAGAQDAVQSACIAELRSMASDFYIPPRPADPEPCPAFVAAVKQLLLHRNDLRLNLAVFQASPERER